LRTVFRAPPWTWISSYARRLVGALSEVGFGIAREIDPEEILRHAVFIFADQIRVDIFTRPWGLKDYDECFARRLEAGLEGIRLPFLGLQDLILSKNTGREQDRADLEALRRIADGGSGNGG
jgi:hypothetical protein